MQSAIRSSTVKHGDHFPEALGTDQTPKRALTQDPNGRVPLVIIDASNLYFLFVRYHLLVFSRSHRVNWVCLVKRSQALRGRNLTRDNQAEDAPMASRAPGREIALPGANRFCHRTSESYLRKSCYVVSWQGP